MSTKQEYNDTSNSSGSFFFVFTSINPFCLALFVFVCFFFCFVGTFFVIFFLFFGSFLSVLDVSNASWCKNRSTRGFCFFLFVYNCIRLFNLFIDCLCLKLEAIEHMIWFAKNCMWQWDPPLSFWNNLPVTEIQKCGLKLGRTCFYFFKQQ